ncbi:MAG TPA: asparagine synthase-related protein [Bryobacteraceae bacterium]
MHDRQRWTADTWKGQGVAAGRIGPPRAGAAWTSADGLRRAWLDGFATGSAGELASSLLSRGPESLLEFSGEFFLIVHDAAQRRIYAATDRFGTRSAYWRAAAGSVAICSQLGALHRAGVAGSDLNLQHVASLLRFNKCRLGDGTLFEGVHVIMPGVVLEYDLTSPGSAPVECRYYDHAFRDEERSEEEWTEEICGLFRRAAVRVSQRSDTLALSLSGGLDSRALLASFDPEQRRSIVAFSCGIPDSADVRLAGEVARCAGVRYSNVDLGPDEFRGGADLSVARNEEFDIFVQGGQIELQRQAAEVAGALMTGWDLDVPLRGTYLNERVLGLCSPAAVRDAVDENWSLFSRQELQSAAQDGFVRAVSDAPEAALDESLKRVSDADPVRMYLRFLFTYEKFRLLMLRNRMARFELETLTPFYDAELQATLARIPERLKVGNRLFARVINRLSPELAKIPYQRTMLPANVPVEFWPGGAEIEARREILLREIYAATGIRVPYRRFYSNFDEWLASDPAWRRLAADLLCSNDTLLTRDILKPAFVRQLVDGHASGSHRSKLICLMSLELYLRKYFNEASRNACFERAGAVHV